MLTIANVINGETFVKYLKEQIEIEKRKERQEILINLLSECRSKEEKTERCAIKKKGNEFLFIGNKKPVQKVEKVKKVKVKKEKKEPSILRRIIDVNIFCKFGNLRIKKKKR